MKTFRIGVLLMAAIAAMLSLTLPQAHAQANAYSLATPFFLEGSSSPTLYFKNPADAAAYLIKQYKANNSGTSAYVDSPSYIGPVSSPSPCSMTMYCYGIDAVYHLPSGTVTTSPLGALQNQGPAGQVCDDGSFAPAGQTCAGKALGDCYCGGANAGDPIDIGSGNVYESAIDYETYGQNKLQFTRSYNSRQGYSFANTLGALWRSNFDRYIRINSSTSVTVERPTGQQLQFTLTSGVWKPDTDVVLALTQSGSNWTLTDHQDVKETYLTSTSGSSFALLQSIVARNGYTQTMNYNSNGQLGSVLDSYGRQLTFTYTNGLISSVGTPDGTTLSYGYTAAGSSSNLTSVTYPTATPTSIQYLYGNTSLVNALTGIVDEAGTTYVNWTYDNYSRGLSNYLATSGSTPQENLMTVAYNDTNGSRVVTNGFGVTDTYTFSVLQGIPKRTQISRAATPGSSVASGTAAATESFTYDSNGFMATMTDWNGNATNYTNNANGDPTTIVEAAGSSVARTTTIAYDPTWVHLPATVTTPGVTTSFTYDTSGEQLTRKFTDTTTTSSPYSTAGQTRTTTNTWSSGLLASTKTPNGNITSFGYSSSGALTSITDPKSHITNITSHTGGGLPLTSTDPNSVTTTYTYDGRQRLLTSSVATVGGAVTTSKTYYNAGHIGTYWPDGTVLTMVVDPGHRPLGYWDATGTYELPLNKVGGAYLSTILDSSNNQIYRRDLWTDALGRKTYDTSHQTGQSWQYSYDPNGNNLTITDPLSNVTTRLFDALNRLYKSTDANTGVTQTTFDAHNRPLTVSDPLSNVTTYVYDGFGDKIEEINPDRGTTVYHYDGDGNLTSKTDAASVVTNWTYDALDRPLTTSYPADSAENVTFTYDQTGGVFANGVGHLTSFTDAAGSVTRTYDQLGNMLIEKRTIGTTAYTTTYTYTSASRIATITYPSGTLVTYTRDGDGRISAIATKAPGQSSVNLASGITYEEMGPVTAVTAFNGDTEAFTYDLDYRMSSLITTATNGSQHQAYTYDYADNLKTITDTVCTACSATYGYDVLNRLTSASGWYGSYAYTMDKNGNMLTNNEQGYAGTYSYTAGTNRISSILVSGMSYPVTTNANGNITGFTRIPGQATTLTYNKANQLASSTGAGTAASYGYNAFRQRVSKTDSGTSATLYFYDQDGNTIEELDGGTYHDYFTLNNRVIGALTPSTNTLAFLHGDKLGSPQLATDANAKIAQSFSYTPYGSISTTTSQSGAATITQNNRFPGQLFDPETLLNHNGFRDYSSALGRYVESDPTGLTGGMNTYAYASLRPTTRTDPTGLCDLTMQDYAAAIDDLSIRDLLGTLSTDLGALGMMLSLSGDTALNYELPASMQGLPYVEERESDEGDVFYHYSSSESSSFTNGLYPNSFATPLGNLTGTQAQQGLALPSTYPPTYVYTVTPPPGTIYVYNPSAKGINGQPGQLPEVFFPNGSGGPGTVSGQRTINP